MSYTYWIGRNAKDIVESKKRCIEESLLSLILGIDIKYTLIWICRPFLVDIQIDINMI
jgi:hypothetical protein